MGLTQLTSRSNLMSGSAINPINVTTPATRTDNLQRLNLALDEPISADRANAKLPVNPQTSANRKVAQVTTGRSDRVDLKPGTNNDDIKFQLSRAGIRGQITGYEAAWTSYPARFEAAQSEAERARVLANSDALVVPYSREGSLTVYQRGGPPNGFEVNLQSRTITNNTTGRTVRLPEGALSVAQQGDRLSVTWSGRPLSSFFAPANARPATPTRSSTPLF
jgi:hypothetical protein